MRTRSSADPVIVQAFPTEPADQERVTGTSTILPSAGEITFGELNKKKERKYQNKVNKLLYRFFVKKKKNLGG